jgi:alkylhydroperoxidase family enzyme
MQTKENQENFTIHTLESAPEKSIELLEKSKKTNGYVPNLHGVLAESPELLEAYQELHGHFTASSFNKDELTVVWQTINVEHECHYCVPAHTAIAKAMNVDDRITEALRNGTELPTKKLETLRSVTLAMVRKRGNLNKEDLTEFYSVGYGQQQLLEIVLGLAQKTISNYTNHLAHTPMDEAFQKFEWR